MWRAPDELGLHVGVGCPGTLAPGRVGAQDAACQGLAAAASLGWKGSRWSGAATWGGGKSVHGWLAAFKGLSGLPILS